MLEKIIEKLKAGDKSAVQEWLDYFEADIKGRCGYLVQQSHRADVDTDDVYQDAIVNAIELAHTIIADPTNGIWETDVHRYVISEIHWRAIDMVQQESWKTNEYRNTVRRLRKLGKVDTTVSTFVPIDESFVAREESDDGVMEMMDLIMGCCKNRYERYIITSLIDHSPKEVALELGLKESTVLRYRGAVYKNVKEELDA